MRGARQSRRDGMKVAQDESVLGRVGWTGVESRQGRLRACLRSSAKDLFPTREPRPNSAVPAVTGIAKWQRHGHAKVKSGAERER